LSNVLHVQVLGNRIGTNAAGSAAIPNDGHGVAAKDASNISIGNEGAGAGNVISGNSGAGILLSQTTLTTIEGNLIGLAPDGAAPMGNGENGIDLSGCSTIVVGGDTAGERNVVSANAFAGILIAGPSPANIEVEGNRVGTRADGSADRGNATQGIRVIGGTNVTIGGDANAKGNVVAFNDQHGITLSGPMTNAVVRRNTIASNAMAGVWGSSVNGASVLENQIVSNVGDGVRVTANGSQLRIVANQILNNGELGIDIVRVGDPASGVTPNDLDDPDTGPNGGQNFPVLTSAVRSNQTSITTITGSLNSNPGVAFTIHLYLALPDPSGHGEAQAPLATQTVTTSAAGDVGFNFQLAGLAPGQQLTATATRNSNGATSEFSANRAVTVGP
jgi:hypothetical protein